MKMYVITPQQKDQLVNRQFEPNHFYNPVQNISGDWCISETEIDHAVTDFGFTKPEPIIYLAPESEV